MKKKEKGRGGKRSTQKKENSIMSSGSFKDNVGKLWQYIRVGGGNTETCGARINEVITMILYKGLAWAILLNLFKNLVIVFSVESIDYWLNSLEFMNVTSNSTN